MQTEECPALLSWGAAQLCQPALLCQTPQHNCAARRIQHHLPVGTHWGDAGVASQPSSAAGLLQGRDGAVLTGAVWGQGCHLPQLRGRGPSHRQSLVARCQGHREVSWWSSAAFSLQPSCGVLQPLGSFPAAGNDNLTQQAELGALPSVKHSVPRWRRLKKPSCFPSSAAEREDGMKAPWDGREMQTQCLPFRSNALGVLSLNKQGWCGKRHCGLLQRNPPATRWVGHSPKPGGQQHQLQCPRSRAEKLQISLEEASGAPACRNLANVISGGTK